MLRETPAAWVGRPPMSAELVLELGRLHYGQHVCLFYDDPLDLWAAIVPYFQAGLARGERCVFLADGDAGRQCAQVLAGAGIDVEREVERGAIVIIAFGAGGGQFEARTEIARLEALVEQTLAAGFTGLRFSGVPPSTLLGERDVLELEALVEESIVARRAIHLCPYDLRRWPASVIRGMLRVHPLAIIGSLVCPNTFYEPPRMALGHCPEEERVRWMIDQLYRSRSAKLALEQAVQARDEFLSAASHELRTPLTSARLHVQAVLRRAETAPEGDLLARWIAPKLERADERLGTLVEAIQRLLDASGIGAGRMELHLEAVDLREVVRDVIARFDDRARHGCDVHVHVDAAAEPVVGRWDRRRLEQVVINVLSNAIKFGAGKPVELRVSRDGARARLVVHDDGIGIAHEDFARIFDRFERGAPVRNYGGFGLGLWIVKQIVQAFGGSVAASGAPGAGATFTIELPLEGGAAAGL